MTWNSEGEDSDDLQYVKNSLDVTKTFLKMAIAERIPAV